MFFVLLLVSFYTSERNPNTSKYQLRMKKTLLSLLNQHTFSYYYRTLCECFASTVYFVSSPHLNLSITRFLFAGTPKTHSNTRQKISKGVAKCQLTWDFVGLFESNTRPARSTPLVQKQQAVWRNVGCGALQTHALLNICKHMMKYRI